jgi:hypothetical protein
MAHCSSASETALSIIARGFKVDCWKDAMVFSQVLPDDYLKKAVAIKTQLKKIALKALNPPDMAVTRLEGSTRETYRTLKRASRDYLKKSTRSI